VNLIGKAVSFFDKKILKTKFAVNFLEKCKNGVFDFKEF